MTRRLFSILAIGTLLAFRACGQGASSETPHLYREAENLMNKRIYEQARLAYGRFLNACRKDEPLIPKATFERAQCLLLDKKTEEGVREMIALVRSTPTISTRPWPCGSPLTFSSSRNPTSNRRGSTPSKFSKCTRITV